MENILKSYEKITILGHDNIDVDAFISGILLSNLLNYLKINNEFIILEKVKENESYHIVKEFLGIDMKDYYSKGEDSKRILFLEDHYKTIHLGKVVACIDHHPTNEKVDYPFYYSRISCSTSYMIYEKMKESGYEISAEEAKMILGAMMIDTASFRSSKTVPEEAEKARELAKQYRLNYEEFEKYFLCLTPIDDNVLISDIINNGYKYYDYNGNKVKSSYIQVYEMVENERISEWIKEIQGKAKKEKLKIWVFIIFDFEDNVTHEYYITENGLLVEKETLRILSRGTDIMPIVEKVFCTKNNKGGQ